MLPATKALPKEMVPIVDKPAIQYIIEELVDAGIEDILIITGRGKRAIEDHFDRNVEIYQALQEREEASLLETLDRIEELADIHYVRQKEMLGTGHAILKARKHIGDEPFAVLFGDDLVVSERPGIGQLMGYYEKYKTSIIGVKEVPHELTSSYGIIKGTPVDDVFRLEDLVEKPEPGEAPSNFAMLGRYIFEPEIFDYLEKIEPSPTGEYWLPDAIEMMMHEHPVYAAPIDGDWHTVGDLFSYLKTIVAFSLDHPVIGEAFREHLLATVDNLSSKAPQAPAVHQND